LKESMMTRMKLLGFLMAGLALVACGDDDPNEGGGGGAASGGGGDVTSGGDTGGSGSVTSGGDTGGSGSVTSGGDTGGGGDVTSGGALDDKQLGELTGGEIEVVCDELGELFTLSTEDLCDITGLLAALAGEDCATAREACISAPPEPMESCDPSGFAGCSATVAEAKACFTAQMNNAKALTCESSLADLSELPPACEVIEEKCPGATGGE
jgi:hypothetical protein